ncbi:MAG TPA: hypothetical protein VF808_18650 [Ktedonobacterales bacterium]
MRPPDEELRTPATILRAAIEALRTDHEHGASWLACGAARALLAAASAGSGGPGARARDMRRLAQPLAYARPSMAAVANTVARIYAAGWPAGAPSGRAREAEAALRRAASAAEVALAEWAAAAGAILEFARPLLQAPILTHSRSGTVERTLAALATSATSGNAARDLIATTSWPGGEGVETARALAASGWRVTLIADAAAGLMMAGARVVALGADSVRADGALVNKVGSYLIALAASAAGVPVYVVCETLKVAPPSWPLALEEMPPAELAPETPAGVTARNVYFDVTPASLIAGYITERGLLNAGNIRALAESAEERLALLAAIAAASAPRKFGSSGEGLSRQNDVHTSDHFSAG